MPQLSMKTFLPQAQAYLQQACQKGIPNWLAKAPFKISPLGQGEYNMNFLVEQSNCCWVMRVNTGSQIGLPIETQIEYEYRTLKLLSPSTVTPQPFFMDNTLEHLPYGVLGMAYLPGEKLDYRQDLEEAARVFARYHQLKVTEEDNHLIREERPLSLTFERCSRMLKVYLESDLADPVLQRYLLEVRSWADEARQREKYFIRDPWNCILNTEVNNTNWILNRQSGTIHLVDWEKPLWGDPSQDLSHFRVPTTTLWKTNYRMTPADKAKMMSAYKAAINDPHLKDTIEERTRLRDPFNCLRGVSWCAMAWVQYRKDEHLLKNVDTFRKLSLYVDLKFVRSLFDPYLN